MAYSISTDSAESEVVEEGVQQYTYYGVLSLTSDCYGAILDRWRRDRQGLSFEIVVALCVCITIE